MHAFLYSNTFASISQFYAFVIIQKKESYLKTLDKNQFLNSYTI